jgi:hypothetical protein
MQTVAVAVGLPQRPSFVSVSTCERRHLLPAVPRRFHSRVHSPTSPIALFRVDSASFLPSVVIGPIIDLGLRSAHRWQHPAPHWGFRVPYSRYQPAVSTFRAEHPTPRYVPSSAFHPPSTVCSTAGLVGLFRPTTTFRVLPSGIWPHRRAVPGLPQPLPSCRFLIRACLSEDGSSTVIPAPGLCSLR